MAKPTKRFSHDEVRFVEVRDNSGLRHKPLHVIHNFFAAANIDPLVEIHDSGYIWRGLVKSRDLETIIQWCEENDFVQETS